MTTADFQVPIAFAYVATFAWASSGALVGVQKQFDITGVFVMALLSSTGGGLLRDAVFLQRTPAIVTDPIYLPLIVFTSAFTGLFASRMTDFRMGAKAVDIIDAVGTPAFAVFGMQLALEQHIALPGVVLIGVINGVGGGLLRDVVVGDEPALLRPGQYSTLTLLLACALFLGLTLIRDVRPRVAGWITVALFFAVRALTVRFNWQTRAIGRRPRGHRDQRRRPPPPPPPDRTAPPPPPPAGRDAPPVLPPEVPPR
jgi:uncharacterized membrane protein YeiH